MSPHLYSHIGPGPPRHVWFGVLEASGAFSVIAQLHLTPRKLMFPNQKQGAEKGIHYPVSAGLWSVNLLLELFEATRGQVLCWS